MNYTKMGRVTDETVTVSRHEQIKNRFESDFLVYFYAPTSPIRYFDSEPYFLNLTHTSSTLFSEKVRREK